MVIKPMIRSNICMNAHPVGCEKEVQDQIVYLKKQPKLINGPKKVLIIGSSTGYGLASRISVAYGSGAQTLGVAFEREASEKRTASMGWYNTIAFEAQAKVDGLYAESINGDAFGNEIKAETVAKLKADLGQVDLVVYSLASPVRTDPATGIQYKSVLKPIGESFEAKSMNPETGEIKEFSIEPASEDEVVHTIKVMGGEDWKLWIQALLKAGVLAPGAKTVAYSYIGPEVTRAVYRDGTIGKAKEDLEHTAASLTALLKRVEGQAFVSVNKALVTRASAVIPVVPLYLALLFQVMKKEGIHEGCIEQMYRLFSQRLYAGKTVPTDDQGRIRLDDWELREDVQAKVNKLWTQVNSANIGELGDVEGYHDDFLRIHGFGRPDIDYDAEVDPIR
ncbi:MAG: trans-2-enoyl-CoA reductase family protein [Spirochaetales bacterium]|nr:trans-2-enoyl-CoA reductase family protein [Spirochaetales bacterium]